MAPRLNTPDALADFAPGINNPGTAHLQTPDYQRELILEMERWESLGQPDALQGLPTQFGTDPRTSTRYPDLPPFDVSQPVPAPPNNRRFLTPEIVIDLAIGAAFNGASALTRSALQAAVDAAGGEGPEYGGYEQTEGWLDALNPFNGDSQLSPGKVWDEMIKNLPDLSPQNREDLRFLGVGPDAAPWDTWGALLDYLRDNPRSEQLKDYGLDFDNAIQQTLDELRENSEELGIDIATLDDVERQLEDTETETETELVPLPPTFPPGVPDREGYYNVIIELAKYSVETLGSSAFGGSLGELNSVSITAVSYLGQSSQSFERLSNPDVSYTPHIGRYTYILTEDMPVNAASRSIEVSDRNGVVGTVLTNYNSIRNGTWARTLAGAVVLIPTNIIFEFVAPADWDDDSEEDADTDFCRAPDLIPQVQEDVAAIDSRVAALEAQIAGLSGQLTSLHSSLASQIAGVESALAQSTTMLFDATVQNVNSPKLAAEHDDRMTQILDGQQQLTNTLQAKIDEIGSPDFAPLQGAILDELGITKADILNADDASRQAILAALAAGDAAVLEGALAGQEAIRQNLLESQVLGFQNVTANDNQNTATILNELNDLDVTVDLSQLPTKADLDTALAAQNATQATDNDEQTSEILEALIDPETQELRVNVEFPDDYVTVDDLVQQTTNITTETDSQIQNITAPLGGINPEDPRTAMDMLRQLAGPAAIAGSVLGIGALINSQTTIRQTISTNVGEVLDRMGPKVDGGLSGLMNKVSTMTRKTWDFLQVDRVLNILNYATNLHNAYMLSYNIVETLFFGLTNIFNLFGLEDADGNPLDVGSMVSQWLETFAQALFGVETLEGIKAEWAKLNRIYQSAMNVIYTMQSIVDSMRSIVEIIGEYVSKIGNALKRSGTIMENSFGWMQERFDKFSVGNNRWEKMFSKLDDIEDVASSFETVTSEAVSIKENIGYLKEERDELAAAIADSGYLNNAAESDRGTTPESAFVSSQETQSKTESAAPGTLDSAQIGFPEED